MSALDGNYRVLIGFQNGSEFVEVIFIWIFQLGPKELHMGRIS